MSLDARVRIHLGSGVKLIAEQEPYCNGRTDGTLELELSAVGILPDERGRVSANEHYQTDIPTAQWGKVPPTRFDQ